MAVVFHKLHSSGNDFIVLLERENTDISFFKNKEFIKKICHRNFGVGGDGVFLIYNNGEIIHYDVDGSESFCVNGSLCLAFLRKRLDFLPERFSLMNIEVAIKSSNPPVISFPLILKAKEFKLIEGVEGLFVDIGNPHFFVEGLDYDESFAKKLRFSAEFPEGANVSFFEKCGETIFKIKTFERGVENFTLACGSACAAFCGGFGLEEAEFFPVSNIPIKVELKENSLFVKGEVCYVAKGNCFI